MEIIRIPRIMQDTCRKHILKGRSVGFVPTMGALHEGHLGLMKRAQRENDSVVVSIFVNPTQFGPSEDFAAYPRDIDNDLSKLRDLGIDSLFIPDNNLMYPAGFSTFVEVGDISERLCGLYRPGHFRGVATVVAKLLNIVGPTRAYFGQKDFQQTVVIRRMVKDLNMETEIVVCPTIREEDGLAMSSRNRYLTPEERNAAAALYRAMSLISEDLRSGRKSPAALSEILNAELRREPMITGIDYAGIFHPDTLEELQETGQLRDVVIAVAARLGKTRLIDNIVVNLD